MDREELPEMLSDSASSLYSYIEDMQFATDPPIGMSVSEVSSYDVRGDYAVLHLSSPLQDTESLMLMAGADLYRGEDAGFTRYDEVSRTIVIRPGPELLSLMSVGHPRLMVMSDMKFLVRAVSEFLSRHSRSIGIPPRPPSAWDPIFPDGSSPSEQQISAVESIMSSGLSYVWGAPGTGKTQFVLATCIRTCIARGLRVAVFAPTNNSVEQVLRGILKAFGRKDLGDGILRLGIPSKGFLLEHPEMCEDGQAQKRAERLRKSIANMEEILFERSCDRLRPKIDVIGKRLEAMSGTEDFGGSLMEDMRPVIALCRSRMGDACNLEGRDLRSVLAEAKSALYDRDRPALDIEEYAGISDSEIAGMISSMEDELESILSRCTFRRVRDVSIIAGTPLQFISRFRPKGSEDDGRMEMDADRIFLDEAGYCNLVHAACLMTNGVPVAMLGDHMQLPPVCEIDADILVSSAAKGGRLRNAFLWDMSALYCEELLSWPRDALALAYASGTEPEFRMTSRCNLTESHRFGQNLASILDRFVYRNGMSGCGAGNLEICSIDARGAERKERANEAEKEAVEAFLAAESPEPGEIAVLTPYADQAKLLRRGAGKYRDSIMTVHASQGREWDTVMLSVADNGAVDRDVPLRFTSSASPIGLKVINTAVSRAKRRLILVCDMGFWAAKEDELIGMIAAAAEPWVRPEKMDK